MMSSCVPRAARILGRPVLSLCSATAMEEDHPLKGPYYPDVVGLVADLLRRQVVYLDDLLLDGVLPAA